MCPCSINRSNCRVRSRRQRQTSRFNRLLCLSLPSRQLMFLPTRVAFQSLSSLWIRHMSCRNSCYQIQQCNRQMNPVNLKMSNRPIRRKQRTVDGRKRNMKSSFAPYNFMARIGEKSNLSSGREPHCKLDRTHKNISSTGRKKMAQLASTRRDSLRNASMSFSKS